MSITFPSTYCGVTTLRIAAYKSQIVMVNKKMMLRRVPMISALCHPNVRSLDAGLIDIFNAAIDIANPRTSVAKCAVSVKIAMELARYPPMH
jgi:hypothetical protein